MQKKKKRLKKKKTPKNLKDLLTKIEKNILLIFFLNSVCTEITLVNNKNKLILMSGSNSPYSKSEDPN